MMFLIDWVLEQVERAKVRRKYRKYPPKVVALQVLLIRNPGLLKKSTYDRQMENWFARHPRTLTTTRPTPYRRGALV